jgi:hypothetical protein
MSLNPVSLNVVASINPSNVFIEVGVSQIVPLSSSNFEDGTVGLWTGDSGQGTVANASGISHSGTHSLQIHPLIATAGAEMAQVLLPIKTGLGLTYNLSLWMLQSSGSARGVTIYLEGVNSGVNKTTTVTLLSGVWTQIQILGVTPSGTDNILSVLVASGTGVTTSDNYFLDDAFIYSTTGNITAQAIPLLVASGGGIASGGFLNLFAYLSPPADVGSAQASLSIVSTINIDFLSFTGNVTSGPFSAIISRNYIDTPVSTYLISSVGPTDVALNVDTTIGFPLPNFELVLEYGTVNQELCLCVSITPNSFLVQRGYDGSTAVSHTGNVTTLIMPVSSAIDLQEMNDHITLRDDDHEQYLTAGRHNNTLLHQAGITIDTDMPSPSSPFDVISQGVSTSAATSDHVHARESQAEFQDSLYPVGAMMLWPTSNFPAGWAPTDGRSVRIDMFPLLFDFIGYAFGGTSDYYIQPVLGNPRTSPTIPPPPGTLFYFNIPNIPQVAGMTYIIKMDSLITPTPAPVPSNEFNQPLSVVVSANEFGQVIYTIPDNPDIEITYNFAYDGTGVDIYPSSNRVTPVAAKEFAPQAIVDPYNLL